MSKPVFYEEVMFLRFGDGTRTGPTVTLQLSDAKALDFFRHAKGTRYMLALAEITDTEEDVKPPADAAPPEPARPALPRGGRLAKEAGIMCADRAFQRQVERDYPEMWRGALHSANGDMAEAAADVIRRHCGIESRAELDHNAAAAERFQAAFRRPWISAEAGIQP